MAEEDYSTLNLQYPDMISFPSETRHMMEGKHMTIWRNPPSDAGSAAEKESSRVVSNKTGLVIGFVVFEQEG